MNANMRPLLEQKHEWLTTRPQETISHDDTNLTLVLEDTQPSLASIAVNLNVSR